MAVAPLHVSEARPSAPRPIALQTEDDAEEIMEAARSMSPYPATRAGLEAMFTELVRVTAQGDHDAVARIEEQLDLDAERFGVAFSFEGNRLLASSVVPGAHARLEAMLAAVGALGPGATVTVNGARGQELSDGTAHGLDPQMVGLRTYLRPAIWYHRVVVAVPGHSVVFEPVAFVGGHWAWLGAPWTALAAPAGAPGSLAR